MTGSTRSAAPSAPSAPSARELLPMIVLLAAALLLAGCASPPHEEPITPSPRPFYDDFGGMEGITATVDAFLVRLGRNERIVHRFAMIDVGRFRRLLIEQFCVLAGGPCEYTGDSMRAAHRTQGIGPDEFDVLVRDLGDAMDDVGIPQSAQNRLLARLAPMYEEIVEQ